MTAKKKRCAELEAPEFLLKEWDKGTKARDMLADLLLHHNGNKDACSQWIHKTPCTPNFSESAWKSPHLTEED